MKSPPFKKILIANRGEIAVRIIRACHEMGINTVAVYSDADREALHVRFAHEAMHIGPPEPRQSYLDVARIVDAARRSGAEAIHPGYGFLAENPDLARACRAARVVFIGPSPEAMEAVGDKIRARKLAERAGVPVVPGSPPLPDDPGQVAELAAKIGYPVLIKASAGGGGRGMRVVERPEQLESMLAQARGEAVSAFGDGTLFLEKRIQRPRHVEVQVLADHSGRTIHLGERECSIQRRHQKLIEESPSPVVAESERERLGQLAVAVMRSAGYASAGTVEFLRGADGDYYFMEVNARLQVEHPVTEEVTGIDLVKEMISIAAGRDLSMAQQDVRVQGHAIECRIIAEDPARGFIPSPGRIRGQRPPGGPGIRYDGCAWAGYTIPVHYDPLIAKLIARGRDRDEAIARMARALDELRIDGLPTSVSFHRKVMRHPAFLRGDLHTGFLEDHPELLAPDGDPWLDEIAVVAAAIAHFRRMESYSEPSDSREAPALWKWGGRPGWRH